MSASRLSLAIDRGLFSISDGPIVAFRPSDPDSLFPLRPDDAYVVQGFRPAYDRFEETGWRVGTAAPGEKFATALVFLPRERALVRALLHAAAAATDGAVVVDGAKTDGVEAVLRNLRARDPASLEVCVFFNKPVHRLVDIPLKYKGFDLPDKFVVGYGLDYREQYRNLPFVGLLHAHIFQNEIAD